MCYARAAVEWVFGDIQNYFAFLEFKKKWKIDLSAVGKMYLACTLLHNGRTCLYGNLISTDFDIHPPKLRSYVHTICLIGTSLYTRQVLIIHNNL